MKFRFLFLASLFPFAFPAWLSHAAGANEGLPDLEAPTVLEAAKVRNSFYFDFGEVNSTTGINSASYSQGYNFGLGHDFGISPGFSLVLDLHYSSLPLSNPSNSSYYTYSYTGGGFHTLMFLANAKFNFNDLDNPVIFYTITGLGPVLTILDPESQSTVSSFGTLYNTSTSYPGITEMDIAIRFGMGIDVKLNRSLALFAEANLVDIFTSNQIKYGTFVKYGSSAGLKVKY